MLPIEDPRPRAPARRGSPDERTQGPRSCLGVIRGMWSSAKRLKAVLAQRAHDRVGVRAAVILVGEYRLATGSTSSLPVEITTSIGWLLTTDARHARGGGDGDLRCTQLHAGRDQQRSLTRVAAAAVDIAPGLRARARALSCASPCAKGDILHRHHAVATARQHRAPGHDFDTVLRRGKGERRVTGRLGCLDRERAARAGRPAGLASATPPPWRRDRKGG